MFKIITLFIAFALLGSLCDASFLSDLSKNPLKLLNKCIQDTECKSNEYCDHTGINPIGSCKLGKDNSQSCVFDRHCKSKICHHLKCVSKKPVKDGPCTKDKHEECLPIQYCSHLGKTTYQCKDRRCSSACLKDAHCLSNKCSLFFCKKPENGCDKPK